MGIKTRHLRTENARLRATLGEQQLRSAAGTQQLAQERARVRIMERSWQRKRVAEACAESSAALSDCWEILPSAADGNDRASDGKADVSELPLAPREPGTQCKRSLEMKENKHAKAAVP